MPGTVERLTIKGCMKYLVIGAGMMGSAAAYDIATRNSVDEVLLADINLETATRSSSAIGTNVKPLRLDVNNTSDLLKAIEGCHALVSAVSYSVNYRLAKAAIQAGVHMCDLGGNNDIIEQQLTLDGEAQRRGVTIVPNCGLAPGLINILAVSGAEEFDELDSIHLRVGGLPQHPRPPLNYQIVFSVEGLINEYVEQAEIINGGKLIQVEGMSGLEEIVFPEPFGAMEAFNTSGGISTLTKHFNGRVNTLDYKTIRYKGHCERFKTLLDLGFATNEPLMLGGSLKTNREFFTDLLQKKLDFGDTDVVLARASISGRRGPVERTLVYDCIDYYDDATKMTAMMRTTAFPTSIIAQMLAQGRVTKRGVMPPELCIPGDFMIQQLALRNIRITKHLTETRS
jgi:lysine 6-dehydrogenase